METQKPLLKDEYGEEVDVHMYRSMIGSLMYITSARPDIMFAVCACVRYQVNPKVSHIHAVKRIFSLVRAATIASRLEAEQDSGNITKTQSKATPNESSSLGTTLGGGPRCQETMGDTITQTRFENVSKHYNDPLLAREKTKTTQAEEIVSLKRRVKKLEQKKRSRTHGLKRLYKVGS
ncbi:hypothetical protein Tco_1408804 [Tanacetum coccineum]